ncbi:MAG: hypothetical protein WC091_10475 [Sulfuricellaceae bacterium]
MNINNQLKSLQPLLRAAFFVALASFCALSWGGPLGRLFFTPEERANLDRARLTGGNPEQGQEQESTPDPQPESLTLNGIVKRSSGKITVWVNHAAQHETDFPSGTKAQVGKSKQADFPVLVQKTGKTVTLKVGQTLNIDSGEIQEAYLAPAATAQPPTPPTAAEKGATPTNETGKFNGG